MYVTSLYKSNGALPNITENEQNNRFFNHFEHLLENLSQKSHKSFIFTDSNINLLQLNPGSLSETYLNSIFTHGFTQVSLKATRMQDNSKTLIDHIITNSSNNSLTTGSIICDISDHFPIFILNGKNNTQDEQKHVKSRIFSQNNLLKFKNLMNLENWELVTQCTEVDNAYDIFWSTYQIHFNNCFPVSRIKFNRKIHKCNNFMTPGLLKSRETKLSLHKASLVNPTPLCLNMYKNYRKLYQKILRASKKLHITSRLNENSKNPRETWKILNEVIGKNAGLDKIQKLNIDGMLTDDPMTIANGFNDFFVKIGKQISDSVIPPTRNFESYLNQNPNIIPLNLQNTTPEHIIKTVKAMVAKNSSDFDGVSSKMIKFIINEIALPLSHIFNLSLNLGVFPSKLKKSRVIPIFKSGDKSLCDNYRPISLLSSISKVLEKIVSAKLIAHLQTNDILYNHQYGFTPGKSTEQNLIQVLNYITTALNDNNFCLGVFVDLKKAFDVCSHDILLTKLSYMGINNIALEWFRSYLSNRTQCVDINGSISQEKDLLLSVIQGSILGPILFLCYINDFYTCTNLFTTLFADDGTCLSRHVNIQFLCQFVNSELHKISNWFLANKMAVNTSKTKFIIFRSKGKYINDADVRVVFNSNEIGGPVDPDKISEIERIYNSGPTKSFKLLGILLDEYLAFDHHVDMLCNKLSKSLYIINRSKNVLPTNCLLTLYYALVHPHLNYCATIYGCASQTNLAKLFLKQKNAVRIITNSNYRAHTAPLFQRLKILPLSQLIHYSNLSFMHNFHHNRLPISFAQMWNTNRNRNPLIQLRNADDYFIPAHRFETLKRLPLFNFPRIWNIEDVSKLTQSKNSTKKA